MSEVLRRALPRLAELAGRPAIVYRGHRRSGRSEIALTFDDGPSEWTGPILDVLNAHGARGTFFVLGASVAGNEDVLRRAVASGHELGNHAFSHRDPATLADGELRDELLRTSELIERVVGARPRLFRPPYGGSSRHVARIAARAGLRPTVLRSVDPEDWLVADPGAIAERVLARLQAGDIIDLHDGSPVNARGHTSRQPTVDALAELLPVLLQRGLRPVTVSELLA